MIPGDLVFWSSTKIVAQVGLDGWLSDEKKKKKKKRCHQGTTLSYNTRIAFTFIFLCDSRLGTFQCYTDTGT